MLTYVERGKEGEREREKRETVICKAEGQLPLKQRQYLINNIPQNLIFL